MGSTYLHLSDQELLDRVTQMSGDVTLVRAQHRETGEFCIGLSERSAGTFMPLSSHTDEEAAKRAGAELAERLNRLSAELPDLHLNYVQ